MSKRVIFAFQALVLTLALSAGEVSPVELRAREIISHYGGSMRAQSPNVIGTMSPQERKSLVEYYRSKVHLLDGDSAVWTADKKMLVYLGDSDFVARAVRMVLESSDLGGQAVEAERTLIEAALPESVAMLVPGILIDEPYITKRLGDVGSFPPKSFGLATDILVIISRSPSFSPAVRAWADDNRKVTAERTKSVLRAWWSENESLLRSGGFDRVRPGRDLWQADVAEHDAIQRRQNQYREGLIAKGKDPSDFENWKEWREAFNSTPASSSPSKNLTHAAPSPSAAISLSPGSGAGKTQRIRLLLVAMFAAFAILVVALVRRWTR